MSHFHVALSTVQRRRGRGGARGGDRRPKGGREQGIHYTRCLYNMLLIIPIIVITKF